MSSAATLAATNNGIVLALFSASHEHQHSFSCFYFVGVIVISLVVIWLLFGGGTSR